MKHLVLTLFALLTFAALMAQTPSEKIFKRYAEKDGVDYNMTTQPAEIDSILKSSIKSVIRTISCDSDESNKAEVRLFKKLKKDCIKLLNRSEYTVINQEKSDGEIVKVCKYTGNGVAEMCVLEVDEGSITFTATQISGLSEDALKSMNFQVNGSRH